MSEENKEGKQDPEKIVDEHRRMVLMTGNLSDFQLENLKKWPFVLFSGLSEVKVDYDFTKTNDNSEEELSAGVIDYYLSFNQEPSESEAKQKLEQLSVWAKFLFWNDTEVNFYKQGEKWEI